MAAKTTKKEKALAPDEVRLRHRESEGLHFGPDNEIIFGIKGGFPPGEVVISKNHPLYELLWDLEGTYLEVVADEPPKVWVSPIDPSREFKSREAMVAHVRALAGQGSAFARMWLEQINGERDTTFDPVEGEAEAVAQ